MYFVYHKNDFGDIATKKGCCTTLRAEFALAPFSMEDTNDKTIDLQRTFSPSPKWVVCIVKLFLTGWALQVLIGDLIMYDNDGKLRSFWMAYLTHWALTFAELYLVLSLLRQCITTEPNNTLTWFTKLLWGLYAVAVTLQEVIALLFWILEFDPSLENVTYYKFMKHGGIMIICLVEGLVVNRIPLRIQQIVFPMIIAVLYLTWTLIHALLLNVGNPNVNGTDGDDDAIYQSISWKRRPVAALMIATLTVVVVVPFLFMVTYVLSLPMRRYIQKADGQVSTRRMALEMWTGRKKSPLKSLTKTTTKKSSAVPVEF